MSITGAVRWTRRTRRRGGTGRGCGPRATEALLGVGRESSNAPARTRTWDMRLRRPMLYPAELQALVRPLSRAGKVTNVGLSPQRAARPFSWLTLRRPVCLPHFRGGAKSTIGGTAFPGRDTLPQLSQRPSAIRVLGGTALQSHENHQLRGRHRRHLANLGQHGGDRRRIADPGAFSVTEPITQSDEQTSTTWSVDGTAITGRGGTREAEEDAGGYLCALLICVAALPTRRGHLSSNEAREPDDDIEPPNGARTSDYPQM